MQRVVVVTALFLGLFLVTGSIAACSAGGGGFVPFRRDLAMGGGGDDLGTTEEVDLANPDNPVDLRQPPPRDLARQVFDLTQSVKAPVGATCTSASACSGPNAKCQTSFGSSPSFPAPGGYCVNTPCTSNADCGTSGFCFTNGNLCLGTCSDANECQQTNANNRCFQLDANTLACLPSSFSACDPTSASACGGVAGSASGACNRAGPDDVGDCLTVCTYANQTCAADTQGNARRCVFLNQRIDVSGSPTADYFAGLACLTFTSTLGPNASCTYVNDCQNGYECDFYGGKTCRKLCRKGYDSTDCAGGLGTCKDAFKLGSSFFTGAVGLCL